MKTMVKLMLAALLLTSVKGNARTETNISLPSLFADHMVLQQETNVPIWGWGEAGSTVRLVGSWNLKDTVTVKTDNTGRWKTEIRTSQYGGPYTLEIMDDRNTIKLKDILLGEVWLCSGQSNMEYTVKNGVEKGEEEKAKANHPNIRFFSLEKRGSDYPQDDCKATWEVCTPDVMWKRSAIAYFFGQKISTDLDVPVGLVVSAWGGTNAEVWLPEKVLDRNEDIAKNSITRNLPWWPNKVAKLYNSMIHPLMPMALAGVLWYQGESNVDKASNYSQLMQKLITCWRIGFGKQLPFYLVQIAPNRYKRMDNNAAILREEQNDIVKHLSDAYLICTNDIGNPNNIHPTQKKQAGERLANLVLRKSYGKMLGKEVESPLLKSIRFENNKIILSFTHAEDGLRCPDKEVKGMMIAGENRKFVPASVIIKKNTLEVSAKGLYNPTAVRYCFDEATEGNLFNTSGLPVFPFRTDDYSF